MENKKGSFLGLVPLIAFLLIYISMGIFSGSFDNMPLLVGILIASGIALLIRAHQKGTDFDTTVDDYCKGGGEHTLILMVIIFLLAGAFYSVANRMHAVDTVVHLGINILPGNLILPGLFIIGCLLSFSMGTSMGTVAALMPIGANIAQQTGANPALVAGVVVGGAMFGDNLSFISDTTIAATRTQEVSMKDKFFTNFFIVLPAVVVNVILLSFVNVSVTETTSLADINFLNLLPYVLIIALSLFGLNVIKVMVIGIVSGVIIGFIHHDFTFVESFAVVQEGMGWMQNMAIIAVAVGGLVAIMNKLGGIQWLLNVLNKKTKTAKGGEFTIAALVSLLDISTTNNTISIIAAGPIARDISDQFGIERRRTASILDIFSSAFNGLLPYAGQLLVAAGIAKVTPVSIMPYSWYSMLMILFGILSITFGIPNYKKKAKKAEVVETADTKKE